MVLIDNDMSEGIKKSSYHFEFVNPRQMKKYKFYFFDYLYYMGEICHENKWGESSWRISGFGVLIWYWGSLSKVLRFLSDEGVFIEYMYSFANGNTANVIIRPNDMENCIRVLTEKKVDLLAASDLYKL